MENEDEDEKRRSTFLKDRYGDYKTWAIAVGVILLCVIIISAIVGLVIGLDIIQGKQEVKVFNIAYDTDYTWQEWFWAESSIKEYIVGPVENQNYQIDLNINELKGGTD